MPVIALIVVAILAGATVVVSWWSGRLVLRQDAIELDGLPSAQEFVLAAALENNVGEVIVESADLDGYVASRQTVQFEAGRRQRRTVGSVGIAAHETAHMLQHATGFRLWQRWWVLSIPALACGWLAAGLSLASLVIDSPVLAVIALLLLTVPLIAGRFSWLVERDAVERAAAAIAAQGIDAASAAQLLTVVRASARVYVAETVFDIYYPGRRLGLRLPSNEPGATWRSRRTAGGESGGGGGSC